MPDVEARDIMFALGGLDLANAGNVASFQL